MAKFEITWKPIVVSIAKLKITPLNKPSDIAKKPTKIIPEIDNGKVLSLAALIKFFIIMDGNCFFDDLAPDLLQHVWDLMDKYEIQEDDTNPVAHDVVNEIQYKLIKRLCVQWEKNYEEYKAKLENGGK